MDIELVNKQATKTSGVRPNFLYGNLLDQMRYIEALTYVKDLDVLDIASGVGWGSFLISTVAKSVKGIDLSEEAINFSKKFYFNNNIAYEIGNSKLIPSADNSFDVIVSFETIEHVENSQSFIDELQRVGKPGALLIISTPNGFCTKNNPSSRPFNPFHLDEYSKEELFKILEEKWEILEYKGQYPIRRESPGIKEYRQWTKDYWFINNIREKNGFLGKLISRFLIQFGNFIKEEPAYRNSCRPVPVDLDHEPVVHYVICKSKKVNF